MQIGWCTSNAVFSICFFCIESTVTFSQLFSNTRNHYISLFLSHTFRVRTESVQPISWFKWKYYLKYIQTHPKKREQSEQRKKSIQKFLYIILAWGDTIIIFFGMLYGEREQPHSKRLQHNRDFIDVISFLAMEHWIVKRPT